MKGWFILLIVLLSGCRTIEYYPVETVRIDSVFINSVMVDSVLVRDSIYIAQKGDTVFESRYKYIYKYRDLTDTVYINRIDSIAVPYPVEKQLSKWEQFKMNIGGWAIGVLSGLLLLWIGYVIVWLIKKRR